MSIAVRIGLKHEVGSGPARATVAALDRFEKVFGVSLPESYRLMLCQVNGGIPRLSRVRRGKLTVARINAFFFLGTPHTKVAVEAGWDYENLWDETMLARARGQATIVPFANDGSSGLFAFKGRGSTVVLIDSSGDQKPLEVAHNYNDFIDMLCT